MNRNEPDNDELRPIPGRFQYRLLYDSAKPEEIIPPLADSQLDAFIRWNFTRRARHMTGCARAIAAQWRASVMTVEHLLLGILECRPLRYFGVDEPDTEILIHAVEVSFLPASATGPTVLSVTPGVRHVIEGAGREAQDRGYQHIGSGPLLLGLTLESGSSAQEFLARYGITYKRLRSGLPPTVFTD
jgi:ATP-dependent Clp protease ATP-binding subunit ClpA